jgi:hypothetical protein
MTVTHADLHLYDDEPDTPLLATSARPTAVDCRDWLAHAHRPLCSVPLAPRPPVVGPNAGSGRRIAVVGGAVHRRHPDLADARVVTWPAGKGTAPDPTATAFASLLVGQGVAHVRGLLPAAVLLVAAVGPTDAVGADAQIASSVRWALGAGAEVIVLPFSRQRLGRRVTTMLHAAIADGVVVFAAAGNLGPQTLAFPAAVTGVVAVTAHDARGVLPQCSRRADLAAPGVDVPAAGLRTRAYLQGCAPATVLAAGSHLAWATAEARVPDVTGRPVRSRFPRT